MPTVAISGGFDPIHLGHVRLIRDAAKYGDVVVILNTDDWLKRKKGYAFMNWDARAEVLLSMKGVYSVIAAEDDDGTVLKSLAMLKPDYFANGGDRTPDNTAERENGEPRRMVSNGFSEGLFSQAKIMADTTGVRQSGQGQPCIGSGTEACGEGKADRTFTECFSNFWRAEPCVGRVADGIPARVGKLSALGNAIVPQVAAEFIKAAM